MMAQILVGLGLSLWIGGLTLWMGVVIPAIFKHFSKEEAGKVLSPIFQWVDRWNSFWGLVTCLGAFLLFLGRHLEKGSLFLEIPLAVMLFFTLHVNFIIHPQVRELKRKLRLPEYQETAHQETIRFAYQKMHQRSVQAHGLVLLLGFYSLIYFFSL